MHASRLVSGQRRRVYPVNAALVKRVRADLEPGITDTGGYCISACARAGGNGPDPGA